MLVQRKIAMNFTAMRPYFGRVLAIGVLIGSACAEAKADVFYNMAVSDGTEAVTGTLTTNGATGTLVAADVLGWDLTAAGKVDFTLTNADSRAGVVANVACGPGGCLQASPAQLSGPSELEIKVADVTRAGTTYIQLGTTVTSVDDANSIFGFITIQKPLSAVAGGTAVNVNVTPTGILGESDYNYSFTDLSGTGDVFIPILDPAGLVGPLGFATLIEDPSTIASDWPGSGNVIPSNKSAFNDPAALLEIPESGVSALSYSFLDTDPPVNGPVLADGILLAPPVPGSPTSVPEPGTLSLLAVAFLGLTVIRRRQRQRLVADVLDLIHFVGRRDGAAHGVVADKFFAIASPNLMRTDRAWAARFPEPPSAPCPAAPRPA